MMKTITIITALLLSLSSFAQPFDTISSPEGGDEESKIIKLLKTETTAFYSNDYNAWASTWTQDPNSVVAWNNADGRYTYFKGWDEINSFFEKRIKSSSEIRHPSFDVSDLHMEISEHLAIITFNEYVANKEMMFIKVPGHKVVKKVKGQWKLHSVISFWDGNFQYSKSEVESQVKNSAYKGENYNSKN